MKDDDKLNEDKRDNTGSFKDDDRDNQTSNLQEDKDKERAPTEEDLETELKIHQAQTEPTKRPPVSSLHCTGDR